MEIYLVQLMMILSASGTFLRSSRLPFLTSPRGGGSLSPKLPLSVVKAELESHMIFKDEPLDAQEDRIIDSSSGRALVSNPEDQRFNPPATKESTGYQVVERGSLYSLDYKIFIIKNGLGPVSPFHDIPLFADEANKIFNMVNEIPRWTNAKMEIDTKDVLNPIKQDTRNGNVRFTANCFPYTGYMWNYGTLPQTWEDPNRIDKRTGQKGDNDPIDVCEIGHRIAKTGEVIQVKILGVIALIDEGETDWKLIVIDINDPLAPKLNDIDDLEKQMPGFLNATVDWFRIYKVPNGNPENQFAFNGAAMGRQFAHQLILESHEYWKDFVQGRSNAGRLSTTSVTVSNAANKMTVAEAQSILNAAPQLGLPLPLDPELDIWHYCR